MKSEEKDSAKLILESPTDAEKETMRTIEKQLLQETLQMLNICS